MKKLTRIAALLAAVLLLSAILAGCAAKDQTPSADTSAAQQTPAAEPAPSEPADTEKAEPADTEPEEAPAPAAEEAAPAADGARITPIASSFDPMALEDCVLPVSFTNDDIELNDEGSLVLHLTIWEQEMFDMVDVAMLKPGDTLVIHGEELAVTSVDRTDNVVHINGGVEAGGVTLVPSEAGGTFYESTAEVAEYDAVYTPIAQATLPVNADEFFYMDKSDLEGDTTYYPGDLLTMQDTVDFSCTAMNGTAHIVNNQIVEIQRSYMP